MESDKERVLVAGATGYLGGFVAREFKKRGHFVRALARYPKKLDHMKTDLDEIVEGQVTDPESIKNICDGIEIVFSSIGITKQKGPLTFKDVDYQGNVNLLEAAKRAGVKKFVYVSVFNGPNLLYLDIIKAHEDFVDELKASGLDYSIIRPTGYFSDMGEFFNMAKRGRIYIIGSGLTRVNPIHGADLAVVCVDASYSENQEIDVGGPETFTYREICELAFKILDKPVKITSVPSGLVWFLVAAVRLFSRHKGELIAFFTTAMTNDVVAPATGTHLLQDYYSSLLTESDECNIR
jgi:uncharacterized protein YbjT (DUF2867 family)